jgi:hypothetical protein
MNVREKLVQEITVIQWSEARMGLEYRDVKSHFGHECFVVVWRGLLVDLSGSMEFYRMLNNLN